jgi:hypothetical protein
MACFIYNGCPVKDIVSAQMLSISGYVHANCYDTEPLCHHGLECHTKQMNKLQSDFYQIKDNMHLVFNHKSVILNSSGQRTAKVQSYVARTQHDRHRHRQDIMLTNTFAPHAIQHIPTILITRILKLAQKHTFFVLSILPCALPKGGSPSRLLPY